MVDFAAKCEYRVLENGVHEFVMYEFSRDGVDEFVAAVDRMNQATPAHLLRYVLIDSTRGTQPLSYLFQRLRELSRSMNMSEQKGARVAVLLQSSVMAGIIGGMMRIFPMINARFFSPTDRDAALVWLQGN